MLGREGGGGAPGGHLSLRDPQPISLFSFPFLSRGSRGPLSQGYSGGVTPGGGGCQAGVRGVSQLDATAGWHLPPPLPHVQIVYNSNKTLPFFLAPPHNHHFLLPPCARCRPPSPPLLSFFPLENDNT